MVDFRIFVAALSALALVLVLVRLLSPGPWTPRTRVTLDVVVLALLVAAGVLLLHVIGVW